MPVLEEGAITSFDVPSNAQDISTEFYSLSYPETPFFNELLVGDRARDTTVKWYEDVLLPSETKLAAAYTAADGTITVANTQGMREDSILSIGSSIYRVTSINRTTKVVAISIVSADANHANASIVNILPTSRKQGAGVQSGDHTPDIIIENYSQIIDDYGAVTGTELAIDRDVNPGDLLAQNLEKKLARMYKGLAKAIWINTRYKAANSAEKSIFGGLEYYISNFGYIPAATSFSADNFDEFLYNADQEYRSDMSQGWMNPKELKRFIALMSDKVLVDRNDQVTGRTVKTYISQYGYELKLRTDPSISPGGIFLTNPKSAKLRFLRPIVVENIRQEGDQKLGDIRGEVTLEVNPCSTMAKFSIS